MLAAVALFLLPRRWAFLPFVLVLCVVPLQQRFVVATLDFDMTRTMVVVGWARALMKGEWRVSLSHLDIAVAVWLLAHAFFYVLRDPTSGALIYQMSTIFDGMGAYFLCRFLVNDARDVSHAISYLAWVTFLLGGLALMETLTAKNPFAFLGGIPLNSMIRDGSVRATISFPHAIMAGTFGAVAVPLTIALLLRRGRDRLSGAFGLAGALALVYSSASSGPALAALSAAVGWACWSMRRRMRLLRWAILSVTVFLHFIRPGPVWQLIGRASDFIGGTGWHRVALIDAFIRNWREWLVAGTESTGHWGWGLADITNQFVLEAVRGGLITLSSFVAVLVLAFRLVGVAARRGRLANRPVGRATPVELLAWGLGVTIVAHCVSWISVSYFGQMQTVFILHLGMIATLGIPSGRSVVRREANKSRLQDISPYPASHG